jgi:hypothetical protein
VRILSWLARALSLGASVGLGACVDNLAICVDSGSEAAIVVQISDAITGAPLGAGARGVITDGGYVDSLRPQSPDASGRAPALVAGVGRPGTYDVTVFHSGYRSWQATNVVVGTNSCGLAGRILHANLEPQP